MKQNISSADDYLMLFEMLLPCHSRPEIASCRAADVQNAKVQVIPECLELLEDQCSLVNLEIVSQGIWRDYK